MALDFDDDISDLLDAPMRPAKELPVKFVPILERVFTENCPACAGTGRWRGVRPCFKCNSTGKLTFKTSPETRAKVRANGVARKVSKLEEFSKEFPEIIAWLDASTKFPFAVSLKENLQKFGSLTDGQIAAARKCIAKLEAAKAKFAVARENAPKVSTNKLEQAFAKANKAAARPGMIGVWVRPISMKSGDVAMTFSNGTNQWAGKIFVKKVDGTKLGHIENGKFVRKFACDDAAEVAVVDCCNDPEKAAVAFGKAFGACAICHRTLTNPESIERGIGPICAEKFGW